MILSSKGVSTLGLTLCLLASVACGDKTPPNAAVPEQAPSASDSTETGPAELAPPPSNPGVAQVTGNVTVDVNRASELLATGGVADRNDAIVILKALKDKDPTGTATLNLGIAYEMAGDDTKAAEVYEEVVANHPEQGEAWAHLGDIQRRKGNMGVAMATFRKGIQNDSENTLVRVGLIDALRVQGRIEEAIAEAKAALGVNSRDLAVYNAFGLVYRDQGDYVLSRFIFDKARRIEGAETNAYIIGNLGWVYYLEGDTFTAADLLKQAVEADENFVPALVYLAKVYMEDRNYSDTVPLLERAAQLEPKNAEIQINLGVAYRGIGKLTEAKQAYQKALALDPSNAKPHFNLAIVQGDYEKDYDTAIASFNAYIDNGGADVDLAKEHIKNVERERKRAAKRVKAASERKEREEARKAREELLKNAPEEPPPEEPAPEEPAPEEPAPQEDAPSDPSLEEASPDSTDPAPEETPEPTEPGGVEPQDPEEP